METAFPLILIGAPQSMHAMYAALARASDGPLPPHRMSMSLTLNVVSTTVEATVLYLVEAGL
jgi:hypothetical protein